jgi:hypothetical protein
MSQRRNGVEEEAAMEAAEQTSEELPERWRARAKTEIVLRLLKGEELGTVAREIQVPVRELERWRRSFLEGGRTGSSGGTVRPRSANSSASRRRRVHDEARDRGVVPGTKGYGEELKKLQRSGELSAPGRNGGIR